MTVFVNRLADWMRWATSKKISHFGSAVEDTIAESFTKLKIGIQPTEETTACLGVKRFRDGIIAYLTQLGFEVKGVDDDADDADNEEEGSREETDGEEASGEEGRSDTNADEDGDGDEEMDTEEGEQSKSSAPDDGHRRSQVRF
jgi:hypothetical protein